jgi:hypothetical protein
VTARYAKAVDGPRTIVAREDLLPAFLAAAGDGTLYDWAARAPDARAFTGRLPAYALRLPGDGPAVVVRHSHHGGLWARVRGDRFVLPRAPRELFVSRVLREAGVPTPEVLGYGIHTAGLLTRRSDVVTAELPPGEDLATAVAAGRDDGEAWQAVGHLLERMAALGAWHPDLNARNVHLHHAPDGTRRAAVLDVDRVKLGEPGTLVARANGDRLRRSLHKLARQQGRPYPMGAEAALVIPEGAR